MDILAFLKTNYAEKDVHAVDVTEGWQRHIGYYFWDAANKVHKLQLIASMRKDDGWEVKDIREMCALCLPVHIVITGSEYKKV